MLTDRHATVRASILAAAVLAALTGCQGDGPRVYPVRGKVVLADGDVKLLAESYIEIAIDGDPGSRADGTIQSDGGFELQTLHAGRVLKGAQAGTYKARIMLAEEGNKDVVQKRWAAVHPRFLDFKTSGLTVQVPTSGEVVLTVSAK